jgi:hypothetical protein
MRITGYTQERLLPVAADKRLKDVQHTLTLVDGSIVEALPRIAMASFREAQSGSGKKMKWTLHTHFEVDRSVPVKINVTPTAGGEHDERAVMDRIQSNVLSLGASKPATDGRFKTSRGVDVQ